MVLIRVLIIQAISISDPKGIDELPDIVKIYSFITINMQFQTIIAICKFNLIKFNIICTVSCKEGNLELVKCQTPSTILAIKSVLWLMSNLLEM